MNTELLQLSYTLETIGTAVQQFWEVAGQYKLIAFSGEMGAGKTTFIHHLCDHLNVTDAVSSPTFALINEYHFTDDAGTDNTIYHMDWYRLRDAQEAMNAGMEDCIEQSKKGLAYSFVEWPEKAREILLTPYLWITIDTPSVTERTMQVILVN